MARLDVQNLTNFKFDNLVINEGAVGHIELSVNQMIASSFNSYVLPRGTVLDDSGDVLKASENARYILAEDIDTEGDSGTVTGTVYKTGTYVRDALIVAGGYTFDDEDAENLRDYGIIVENAQ